ncbi:MAG: acyl-CoA dehydrogenase family protein, partial [Actinobacteria bacterium]|nr:acyl-CoA dehydrogenase family protein [Actinomycetota bacterium]
MSTPHAIFTPEHEELRSAVRRFVEKELAPNVDEWEEAGYFPDWVFERCGELGFLGLHYPERWGGAGGDLAAEIVFVEELARCGAAAIAMAVSVQTDMATPALAEFGTDDQLERYLRPAIAGKKIAAIAITEPDAGSDVAAITTRAVRDGDTWVVNGRKMFITNGSRAHFLTCVVQTEPGSGHGGISLFIVDTDLPGVSVSRKLEKLGMRSSDTAEIALDDVPVPHANLIGLEPGQGFAQLMWQLQYERMAGAAASVGHAQRVLEDTIAFSRERTTFGKPIAEHQVIAHMLADAATELEAGRALVYSTVWRILQGEYPVAEISMAKKYCAQMQNRLVDTCLQVHGGAGYMDEYPVSRAFRDARLQRIGAGTDQIM